MKKSIKIKGSDIMPKQNRADEITMQERVYEVSRLLRRKPQKYIIHHITEKYKVDDRQARNYIRLARKEWKKYFEKLKGDGMAYHISQMRDLKDKANERKVVIGRGENKQVIEVPDLNLILDITKEEAKLMGVYPAEKHEEIRKIIRLGVKEKETEEEKDEEE